MKLLIISDTHGRLQNSERAINNLADRISAVIHLGDMLSDARLLEAQFDIPFYYVAGNCDLYYSLETGLPADVTLELNGIKLLLTHGHLDSVKHSYSGLAERAKKNGATVALCGHTHEPFNKTIEGVLCVNPGSASFPRGSARRPSYAVLDIPDDVSKPPTAGIVEIRPNSP